MTAEDVRALLAPEGTLRAAINTGNRALVQVEDEALAGVSPDLARRLAAELDVALEPVVYEGAGKVVADAGAEAWTLAFLAVDPSRADRLAFTRPYLNIDTTYAVRGSSQVRSCAELDRAGVSLLVAQGSAYDLHLTQALAAATLVRAETPPASIRQFLDGEADAVAGVRETLEAHLGQHPEIRLLPDAIVSVGQAMAVPLALQDAIPFLDEFLDRARAAGAIPAGSGG